MNTVRIEVKDLQGVLADVSRAWETGEPAETTISFESLEALWKILSPRKMEILQAMSGAGPMGIREVSRKLGRDVSAVHRDIQALISAGILQRTEDGKVLFPYDRVHVDFMLQGAA